MKWGSIKERFAAGFTMMLIAGISGMQAQAAAAEPAPQMAEQVYKNIQEMKGVLAEQVNPAMDFFRISLGVKGCTYCHLNDGDHFEVDEKPAKNITRQMMQMTLALNRTAFGGHLKVTCYTCHRGTTKATEMPPLLTNQDVTSIADGQVEKTGAMPAADQLIEKYVNALGGTIALQQTTSRAVKGTVTDTAGHTSPMEVFAQTPAKRISILHLPKGDSFTLYNGEVGWSRSAVEVEEGVFTRNMRREDLDATRFEDPLYFAGRMTQVFADLRTERIEQIGDREAYVVFGLGRDTSAMSVNLYFDKDSGLLVRLVRYTESPYGRVPLQIDYGDYRNADGVKFPFRWTVIQPGGRRYTYQADEIHQNIRLNNSRFAMPASAGCTPPRCSPPS